MQRIISKTEGKRSEKKKQVKQRNQKTVFRNAELIKNVIPLHVSLPVLNSASNANTKSAWWCSKLSRKT